MPLHEYKCPAGHITTRIVSIKDAGEPKETTRCTEKITLKKTENYEGNVAGESFSTSCGLKAARLASQTGKPILKRGIGGFYKPNA